MKPRARKQLSALAKQRAAYADKVYPKLKRALAAALADQVRQFAAGGTAKPSAAMRAAWKRALVAKMTPFVKNMAAHGWGLAGEELGVGDAKTRGRGEQKHKVAPLDGDLRGKAVEIGGWERFLQRGNWDDILRWINTTAESASDTTAARLTRIFAGAAQAWDAATKRGETPVDIAKRILADGLAQTEARAQMLAHTVAIWAYNEGAGQRYQAEGVAVQEWLTADDDLRCPFCAEMNGKRVETGAPFFQSGDTFAFEGSPGALKIPSGDKGFDVRHPPLHPNCRCTLIPIVDERQREPEPEPAPPEAIEPEPATPAPKPLPPTPAPDGGVDANRGGQPGISQGDDTRMNKQREIDRRIAEIEAAVPIQRRNTISSEERPDLNKAARNRLAREEYLDSLTIEQRNMLEEKLRLQERGNQLQEEAFSERQRNWAGNIKVAAEIEAELRGSGIAYSRQDALGGSIYFNTDAGTIRVADHLSPGGGGYDVNLGERHGNAAVDVNPHGQIAPSAAVSQLLRHAQERGVSLPPAPAP